jgi:hypothetical protein
MSVERWKDRMGRDDATLDLLLCRYGTSEEGHVSAIATAMRFHITCVD